MADDLTQQTFASTYKDDWNEDNNYHRILFNSGRALQARELTQLQTIIQEEIARFGSNIFKDGAAVSLGKNHVTPEYKFVRVTAASNLSGVAVGDIYQGGTSSVKAEVLEVNDADDTLYIHYIDGAGGLNTTFSDGETLNAIVGTGGNFTALGSNATGAGVKFSVGEGDFFVAGHFVHCPEQSILIEKYSQNVNTVVGFKVEEKIITVNDPTYGPSLYDNAGDAVNTSSPGADRYQINLTLVEKPDPIPSGYMFVFLARIENGTIVQEINQYEYNDLDAYLATRTKEESGDYIVSPYNISFDEGSQGENFLQLNVDGGHAYVNGYRAVTPNTSLVIPKPQETILKKEEAVGSSYGNYFLVDLTSTLNLDNLTNFLSSGTTPAHTALNIGGGGVTGTCICRGLELEGTNRLRVFVYNVNVTAGNLPAATTLSTTGITLTIAGTEAILYETGNNTALMKLPTNRPSSIVEDKISQIISRTTSFSVAATSTYTLPAIADGDYVDPSLWILWNSTDNSIESGATLSTTQITNLTQNKSYTLLHYVQLDKITSRSRTKTIQTTNITGALTTAADGTKYLNLGQYDIIDITEIKLTNSGGDDASSVFTLDNGQRDNYYTEGRIILDQEFNWTGNVYCSFRYWGRSVQSDDRFYSRSSYPVGLAYKDIPKHKKSDGTVIELRDYLDFRPDIPFGSNTVNNEFALPRTGSNIIMDVNYYLPRADKILVDESGVVQVLMGQQAEDPTFKKTPDNSLELYKVLMNPNTLDASDMQITPIEHKRYTMADIAKLEAKIDRLAETTELSLLELESRLSRCLDEDGNERPETGEHVDDGNDQSNSDTENSDYCASVDPDSKLFRPCFDEDNIRLIYDGSNSTNVVLKGDNVYLDYEEVTWIDQPDASESAKVNPYGFVDNVGCLELSPSSDEWKSKYAASRALGQSNRVDVEQAYLWNSWQWNWIGRANEDYHIDPYLDFEHSNAKYGAFGRKALLEKAQYFSNVGLYPNFYNSGRHVRRIIMTDTLRQYIGRRALDVALIPWIRNRKIYFKAMGLKPNTLHKAFFDNTDVSSFCKSEAFNRYASTTVDDGNLNSNLTSVDGHPNGSTSLVSDSNGTLTGSFYIPSTRPGPVVNSYGTNPRVSENTVANSIRWRAGAREFKLLDTTSTSWFAAGSKAAATYTVSGAMPLVFKSWLSTRQVWHHVPYSEVNKPVPYNYSEVRDEIDNVPSSYVQLVEPHLAGSYGTQTPAVSPSSYSGQMSRILFDYIGDNNLTFPYGYSQILPQVWPQKPLAQSFVVDNPFGVVLTNVKLYFKTKDETSNIPVSIQIRPMTGDRVSDNDVIPGSCVFVNAADVNTSSDATVTTTFEFEEPVYLNANTKYALCVLSQSPKYEVFTATNNKFVLDPSRGGVKVTRQHAGDLYSPATGGANFPIRGRDLSYQMTRAKFSPKDGLGNRASGRTGGHNGSLILRNAGVPPRLLHNNPIKTTQNSTAVYVTSHCHGLSVGDQVTISGATATGGISAGNLNLTNTSVIDVDLKGFVYNAGAAATNSAAGTTIGGGSAVQASRNIQYDIVSPYIETIIPPLSSTDVSGKLTAGRSLGDVSSETPAKYTQDTTYTKMVPFLNHSYNSPRIIANSNQESVSGIGRSAYIKVDLKSGNDYVSPIVDLQRASLVLVSNCIDDDDSRSYFGVDQTYATGGGPSAHITTPITVAVPSVGFQLKVKHIIPEQANVTVYYRTATTNENIYEKGWTAISPLDPLVKGSSTWREAEYLGGGTGGTLTPFNKIQAKFVMHTTNTVFVPVFKDLKWKFLAV